ncbi:MAG: type IV pilus assembly protein PilM [Planctomycetota bacterium]|nr:type IV pilus assembly protein PilM [Planctomycetota bacterium]
MASSSACWGLEIGASAIKAIKLEGRGEEGVRVLEYAVVQHPKPLSTPGVDANDVLRVSLGALTSQHDLTKGKVAVSVPGHAGFARFAKLPPVEPKKVPDIVKFEAMQQIPFPLEQVEWDYQTFVSPDSPEIEVGIFAITKDRVTERLSMLADFGIAPSSVVLSPIAVYNALAYDLQFGPTTPGTIIVDVGTTSTDLVIATPGRMWVRTFPLGGHQFTEALVSQFQLSYPKAEKLKREAEDSKHARQVFQAMRPVFTDLAQDIQRSIGYYQSLNRDANLTRLIGVGSTFALPGLRKYLKQQLSMDVYRIEEFRRAQMEGSQAGDAKSQALNTASVSLCTAYGLALHGLELNAVGGNLMPVSVLRKAMWREKVPWFGLAAGVAALASGVMFIGPVRDYMEVTSPGALPPPIIAKAVSDAQAQKQAATEAGVTSAGEPDMRAANMIALLDNRGIYPLIHADLAEIVALGNDRAKSWAASLAPADGGAAPTPPPGPAYAVRRFETEYHPPEVENPDAFGGAGAGIPSNDELGIAKFPRIKCTLQMSTNQPEARRFVDETIGRWLVSNAKRATRPYEIRVNAFPASVAEARATASATAEVAAPGTPGRGTQQTGAEYGRPGRGVMPGTEMDLRELDERQRRQISRRNTGPAVGEGPIAPADQQAGQNAAAALEELNTAAPIEEVASTEPVTGTVNVTWWVVFVPAEQAGEGGTP